MFESEPPLVTAIVSTYASEKFMGGCLTNLVNQSIFDKMEVIVVDASSPEDEGSIVRKFQEKYSNIRYIRTPERIGIYHAWNVGIREAKGRYLTNANTDDRRHPQCTEKLIQALESNPESVLAYCDTAITNEENKDFHEGKVIGQHNWLDHDHMNLIRRCEIGPMPVWKASLHDEIGLFDERFFGAGDYEFWLRASENHSFVHVKEILGLYLSYDNNLETRNMQRKLNEEYFTKSTYINSFLDRGLPQSESSALLDKHTAAVRSFLSRQDGISPDELNKFESHYYACAMLLAEQGNIAEAIRMLEDWLRSINLSKNIGHLLYGLLLRQPETASLSNSKVSFVVVDNAHPELLGRTLKSIFAQKHENWELTIITSSEPGQDGIPEIISGLVYSTEFQEQMRKLPPERISFVSCSEACADGCMDGCPETGPELDRIVKKAINNGSGDYICLLHSGGVLVPGYISEAALMLDQNEEAAWVAPKTLFFSTTAIPAWGIPFSFKHALTEPPAVRPSIFRRTAWASIDSKSLKSTDFESWELWIALAEQGWTRMHMEKFGVIRNIAHEEALQTVKKKALHNIVSYHPWWFSQANGTININENAISDYEQAGDRAKKGQAVSALKKSQPAQRSEHGKMRLVRHYLDKGNSTKALSLLKQILAEIPDDAAALELQQRLRS